MSLAEPLTSWPETEEVYVHACGHSVTYCTPVGLPGEIDLMEDCWRCQPVSYADPFREDETEPVAPPAPRDTSADHLRDLAELAWLDAQGDEEEAWDPEDR